MRSRVPLAVAAVAAPLLAVVPPAAAERLTDFRVTEVTFTSTESGEEVTCFVTASASREDDGSGTASTESSGDFSECYNTRVEVHATWTDDQGRTVRVSDSRKSFLTTLHLDDVGHDLAARHEVTYALCDPHDQCHYEVHTAAK